jgi:DNA-binding transcriptional LysR family regulator
MTIRHLDTFLCVIDEKSISRAAQNYTFPSRR